MNECDLDRMKDAIRSSGAEYWSFLFEEPQVKHFVLLEKDGGQPIGVSHLSIEQSAHGGSCAAFESSHILSSFRGYGLSQLLYQARLNYLQAETDCSLARVCVSPKNTASAKAAERNGFCFSHQENGGDGGFVNVYERHVFIALEPPSSGMEI